MSVSFPRTYIHKINGLDVVFKEFDDKTTAVVTFFDDERGPEVYQTTYDYQSNHTSYDYLSESKKNVIIASCRAALEADKLSKAKPSETKPSETKPA
jgi:hypothetical protein